MMGASTTLSEDLVIEDGQVINGDLKDYKILTSMDYVPVRSRILEVPYSEGPFGAKGCGEAPIIATAPAISNAVYNALGVRFRSLPITGERVVSALKNKRDSEPVFVD